MRLWELLDWLIMINRRTLCVVSSSFLVNMQLTVNAVFAFRCSESFPGAGERRVQQEMGRTCSGSY